MPTKLEDLPQVMAVQGRLADRTRHTRIFSMDLAPSGAHSRVLLDGEDISDLLCSVHIHSGIDIPTKVELDPALGHRAEVVARVPEAQIMVADPKYFCARAENMQVTSASRLIYWTETRDTSTLQSTLRTSAYTRRYARLLIPIPLWCVNLLHRLRLL